jgi:hypothetical protein
MLDLPSFILLGLGDLFQGALKPTTQGFTIAQDGTLRFDALCERAGNGCRPEFSRKFVVSKGNFVYLSEPDSSGSNPISVNLQVPSPHP